MPDPHVEEWNLEGTLSVWRYVPRLKNMDGWHLSAEETACRSLADLIDRILASPWPNRKRVPVQMPPTIRHVDGAPLVAAPSLTLCYPAGIAPDDHWHLRLTESALTLTVGESKLRELQRNLLGLPWWRDDFAMRPEERTLYDDMSLWFWTKI